MKRVLVVDDEYDLAEAVRAILEDAGYEVGICANGKLALDALTSSEPLPDLILLDIMMPVLSGPELLEAMRKHAHLDSVPVVMMSAVRPPPDTAPRWKAFLKKPFEIDDLLEKVAAVAGSPDAT